MNLRRFILYSLSVGLLCACSITNPLNQQATVLLEKPTSEKIASVPIRHLLESSREQTKITTGYTQAYFTIPYPAGDVPAETGACVDVVVRSFRNAGVDLQKEVHDEMVANFSAYPQKWGQTRTDTNIDHRRVPNLQSILPAKVRLCR